MGRDIKFAKDEWRTYIFEAFDNRLDPDPVTMEIHWLSGQEYRKYRDKLKIRTGHGDVSTNQEQINRKLLANNVRNIKDYRINNKPITTGEELYDYGEPDVVDEILDVLTNISRLEDGELGKLNSQSASGRPTTKPSSGIA